MQRSHNDLRMVTAPQSDVFTVWKVKGDEFVIAASYCMQYAVTGGFITPSVRSKILIKRGESSTD